VASPTTNPWGPPPSSGQLTAARRVAAQARQEALAQAADGALTLHQVAERLGLEDREVFARVAAGELLTIDTDDGDQLVPAWQLRRRSSLPGLADLIAAWPGANLTLSLWAVAPCADLGGRSPAEELARRGGRRRVMDAVQALTAAAW
jgi:hypothetical protein